MIWKATDRRHRDSHEADGSHQDFPSPQSIRGNSTRAIPKLCATAAVRPSRSGGRGSRRGNRSKGQTKKSALLTPPPLKISACEPDTLQRPNEIRQSFSDERANTLIH